MNGVGNTIDGGLAGSARGQRAEILAIGFLYVCLLMSLSFPQGDGHLAMINWQRGRKGKSGGGMSGSVRELVGNLTTEIP